MRSIGQKLVIGAICMMAVATVPTRVNAETLPEEKGYY